MPPHGITHKKPAHSCTKHFPIDPRDRTRVGASPAICFSSPPFLFLSLPAFCTMQKRLFCFCAEMRSADTSLQKKYTIFHSSYPYLLLLPPFSSSPHHRCSREAYILP